jgi:hypothetical protein
LVLAKTWNGNGDGEQMLIYIAIKYDGSMLYINLLKKAMAKTDGELTP